MKPISLRFHRELSGSGYIPPRALWRARLIGLFCHRGNKRETGSALATTVLTNGCRWGSIGFLQQKVNIMRHHSFSSILVAVAVSSLAAQELPRDLGKLAIVGASQDRAAARCRASHLVGCPVIDSKSKSLGEIQDVVLDVDNHRIAYAVLTFQKSLGMKEQCFAMPWRLIEVGQSAGDKLQATLSLDRAMLKAAPGFDNSDWPDMTVATWCEKVDSYYSSHDWSLPQNVVTDKSVLTKRVPSHCLLSKLYGTEVIDEHHRTLATAEDLVVDIGSAKVQSVLLSFGGNLGRGEHLALVPSESLSVNKNGFLVLPCSAAGLKAMALTDGKLPILSNDSWLTNARKLCAEACEASSVGSGDVILSGTSAAPSVLFADSYDLANVETINGKISTVGSVLVGKAKEERVRLRIVVGEGREVIVYAAPPTFESQQALRLRAGNTVKVTGAPAKHCTHTVLMAGDITCSGKTAKLRDSDGHPSWMKK